MKIGFIPGALDMLSGKYFPHLVHMQENVKALEKKCEITVLSAHKANAHYRRFQRSGLYGILNRKHLHPMRKVFHLLFYYSVHNELKNRIRGSHNDLFIVRYSLSNYFLMKYLREEGYKILLEVHGLAYVEESEYGQSIMPSCYYSVLSYVEKRMLGWADKMTTGSEASKRSLMNMGLDAGRIYVVPNAVESESFSRVADPQDIMRRYDLNGKTVVGFVGSFARYHGLEILIDIGAGLQEKFDNNVVFLLVGRNVHGTDSPRERILTRRLGHMFTFTGEVPHFEVPSFLAAMDITIIPDSNTYGSPMKLFEYMAMKKAIVAPDVPPIREIIEDGKTGILFERGDSSGATKAVEKLVQDEALRDQLGRRAHEIALRNYTWERRADRIVEIAESMTH
jgi:glycosyltransferase involved in cell wall biosynthesis